MNNILWESILSHMTLIGVVWFFLRRIVQQFDTVVTHVQELARWRERVEERHRIEDLRG